MNVIRVSAALATLPQPSLWPETDDRPLTSPALIRWHVGMWFQEASRVLTGATPHVTDGGADVCPDLSHAGGGFLEVKALAGGRESILFRHRLDRDEALVRSTGRTLTYLYWIHTAPVLTARTLFDLRAMLAGSTSEVLVVPYERIRAAVRTLPVSTLEYRADGGRMRAYRLCKGLLRHLARGKVSLLRCLNINGSVVTISLNGPDLGRAFLPLTDAQRAAAGQLRAELSEHALSVELTPAPRPMFQGHCVRTIMDGNPSWYSRLCNGYTAKRRRPRQRRACDTDIRRRFVERSLDRLAAGVCRYEYDWRLRPIVERAAL